MLFDWEQAQHLLTRQITKFNVINISLSLSREEWRDAFVLDNTYILVKGNIVSVVT